ncbi:MAG TPA: hypothetical protein VN903_11000 [Polyangia bacterium]|nr:hypothetical protein [Polyangia bacterium]
MTTWSDARQAIFDTIVKCTGLPAKHLEWGDAPQSFNCEPQFTISILSSREQHGRLIKTAGAGGFEPTVSMVTEFVVTVRCQSIATTRQGKPLDTEPGRRLALDALERLRMSSWRPDIVDSLRAHKLTWYDDQGIIKVPFVLDGRALLLYSCDLNFRGEIFLDPKDPLVGTIEHVRGEGTFPDPPRSDITVPIVEDRP